MWACSFSVGEGLASYKARQSAPQESQQQEEGRLESLSPIMSSIRLLRFIRTPPQLPTPTLVSSKLIFCVIPIVEIVIGAVYLNACPRQHYIPIYLIVAGVFAILLALLSCLPRANEGEPTEGSTNPLRQVCRIWNTLTSIFLLAWFITGSVWIYSIYEPNYDKNTTDVNSYCNKRLYLFAFWITTLVYILMAISLVISLCSQIYSCLFGRANTTTTNDDILRR